ncbi:DR2241 family protein [Halobiforma nitratireducens]|uniref:Uncharacterized protein n=1 Tax=Halobiforma nitratireducens JCM 10879 TaxID=1227454 RepID=M0M2S9_9EURY|nr:DR2241 family protein [Halobiforma nitratireducens]EMA39703.1 hypothetical protein C446_08236 [Halobiforma nitratireducens JCM 10879]
MTAPDVSAGLPLERDALEPLLDRAEGDGISFDGLELEPVEVEVEVESTTGDSTTDERRYEVETPETDRRTVTVADLLGAEPPVSAYVSNWYYWQATVGGDGTARRAFLRWCERAPLPGAESRPVDDVDPLAVSDRYAALRDGIEREWGQVQVTARFPGTAVGRSESDDCGGGGDGDGNGNEFAPGERVYDLHHREDADTPLAALERYGDPRDIREIVRTDLDGRYRPLKTAPTLEAGWIVTGLSGAELIEAIRFLYPATIANWHRERQGILDVDHWQETASRQTGMYASVDSLPREAVDRVAEACCVDSQCLKRREWEYAADDELEVDGGDGRFPCREPCSLVVAAARKWAAIENEPERTYELELTPSERQQLTELIEAVAEGRTRAVREADLSEGANRYRTRYLRAKRFGDDGTELEARVRDGANANSSPSDDETDS